MIERNILRSKIFTVDSSSFEELATNIFIYQYECNKVYRDYCDLMHIYPQNIKSFIQIPFLPIELFKTHKVVSGNYSSEYVFESSGTTGQQVSHHYVQDITLYEESFFTAFKNFIGNPEGFGILALLPSYAERNNSSLIYMVEKLMKLSNHNENKFFLNNHDELASILQRREKHKEPTVLLGVSFALLDFAEHYPLPLQYTKVIETGGMKGRRTEITREELHHHLQDSFKLNKIYSEYGMTELLSQAYSMSDGRFHCPGWMKVLVRDVNDPLQYIRDRQTGVLNIIDLANLDSCSFLATSDSGKRFEDGSFEVLGRIDQSDVRGCNLMWD